MKDVISANKKGEEGCDARAGLSVDSRFDKLQLQSVQ